MVSANLGYEFTDPVSGQMILGAPRTRVVGVTPLGDPKRRDEIWWNKTQVFILMKEAVLLNKEMIYFMSTCLL